MLILDTDLVSILEGRETGARTRLRERLSQTDPSEQIAVTIISYEEQMRGWMTYLARAISVGQQVDAYGRLRRHVENYKAVTLLDFDAKSATAFQHLLKTRVRIGTMDLKIAAIALTNSATLLSRNLSDFEKVPGRLVEDWTRP
jgi:tRNA(fMet)-specific endonuclease VapC